jgi:hypothetical protein
MTKPGDLQTKKTLHELAKEFPEKTYRELEKYRDADRREEAQRIFVQQENEELKEDQLTESQKSQDKLEPIGMGHNHPPGETFKKACTLGEMKKDRSYPDLAEVLAQENDRLKKEIKNLKWIKDHDYIFLVDENKKLHKEIKELKEDNKKLAHQIEDRINSMRKSGM